MSDRYTLLYVDDDAVALDLFKAMMLKEGGYEVVTCASPEVALKLAKKCDPDCILLDWAMPEINGLTLLQLLRGEGKLRFTPIFMLTGRTKMEDAERALESGANGYFTKPLNFRLIAKRIEKAVLDRVTG